MSSKSCCGGACATKSGCSLLTWSNPVASAKVFVSIIASLALLKHVNVLSLFFRLGSVVLAASAAAEFVGKKVTGQGFVTKYRPATKNCLGTLAEKYASHAVMITKTLEVAAQDFIFAASLECTAKLSCVFFLLYKITSYFSLWTILTVATVLAFSVPPVYLKNQKAIDEAAVKFSDLAKEKASCAASKAKNSPLLSTIDEKLGPVSKFIKSKLPVRTAGSTVGESKPELIPTATSSGVKVASDDLATEIKESIAEAKASTTTSASISNPLSE